MPHTQVLSEDPANVKALYRRGEAHAALNSLEDAAKDLQMAVAASPADAAIKVSPVHLPNILSPGQLDRPERCFSAPAARSLDYRPETHCWDNLLPTQPTHPHTRTHTKVLPGLFRFKGKLDEVTEKLKAEGKSLPKPVDPGSLPKPKPKPTGPLAAAPDPAQAVSILKVPLSISAEPIRLLFAMGP
jgi:hypothetical protein